MNTSATNTTAVPRATHIATLVSSQNCKLKRAREAVGLHGRTLDLLQVLSGEGGPNLRRHDCCSSRPALERPIPWDRLFPTLHLLKRTPDPPGVQSDQFSALRPAVATRRAPEGQKAPNFEPRSSNLSVGFRGIPRASGGRSGRFRHPRNTGFHPGSIFDGPGARKRPPETENAEKPPRNSNLDPRGLEVRTSA